LRDIILCAAVNIEILVKNLTMWMCHVTWNVWGEIRVRNSNLDLGVDGGQY
jgi:hypothetical protein